jgi:hypothetical protein
MVHSYNSELAFLQLPIKDPLIEREFIPGVKEIFGSSPKKLVERDGSRISR